MLCELKNRWLIGSDMPKAFTDAERDRIHDKLLAAGRSCFP